MHNARMGLARRPCEDEDVGKDAARAANQARAQEGGAGCGGGGGVADPGKPAAGRGRAGGGARGLCPAPLTKA